MSASPKQIYEQATSIRWRLSSLQDKIEGREDAPPEMKKAVAQARAWLIKIVEHYEVKEGKP